MTLIELHQWLRERPGVLLNLGVDNEPTSVFLAWLTFEEGGQQLEVPWRVDGYQGEDALEQALSALTKAYDRRVADRGTTDAK